MASPSPWPSDWCTRWEPGYWKGSNSRSIWSGGTVGPVLVTLMAARPGGEMVETSTSLPVLLWCSALSVAHEKFDETRVASGWGGDEGTPIFDLGNRKGAVERAASNSPPSASGVR